MTSLNLKILGLAGLLVMALIGTAQAEPNNHSVVRDSSGVVVRNTYGNCVITKWIDDKNTCPGTITADEGTVYFHFNSAALSNEATTKLHTLVGKLKSTKAKSVQVVGYADRIGNASYNEKLSQKRAEAVRKFLVKSGFVGESAVKTRWLGDTEPSTDCPNNLPRKKLIDCLQADRRVEVEVMYQ
jgi:outer membrane protein OmpA-like peptidoglycan-associated protein